MSEKNKHYDLAKATENSNNQISTETAKKLVAAAYAAPGVLPILAVRGLMMQQDRATYDEKSSEVGGNIKIGPVEVGGYIRKRTKYK